MRWMVELATGIRNLGKGSSLGKKMMKSVLDIQYAAGSRGWELQERTKLELKV